MCAVQDMADRIDELEAKVERLRAGIREALWWAEQHTDSAVTRRLRDYRKTVDALVTAVQEGALTALRNHCSDPND
jgi:hypothetical protein